MLDRESERRAVDDMLDLVRQGFSGALVLRGGHGVGKTTLVEYAITAATGFQVCEVVGVESEVELEFAAVHQLIMPFLPLVDDLPVPQRQAINIAFGIETGKPPDPFLVALGCLTLMSRAAQAQPALCVVDDAQWIDAESAVVLGFVARRLYADRVGMILAIGETGEPRAFEQLRTVHVGGLPDDAAAELLQAVLGAPLEVQVVGRVLDDTGRNALALVEVGSQFAAEELAEMVVRPEPVPVGPQLEQRYRQQVSRLSADAQEFVLLTAADGSGERGLVRRAAECASIDADGAETAAEMAGLIEVAGNSVRFRHPLIRTAAYNGATDADRRHAHRVLSEACASDDDYDRQMWHRAAATAEPDEIVAAELQAAAARAAGRGAWTMAASLMRRAVDLSRDRDRRAGRQVALAEAELVIGHPDIAWQAAGEALPRLPDDGTRGRAKVLRGESLFAQGRDSEAAELLVEASRALASDPNAATDALLAAFKAAMWAGPTETQRIASVAVPPPRPSGSEPRVSDLLLAGYLARYTTGYDAAAAPLREAVRKLRADDTDDDTGMRWFGSGAAAAASLWDDEAMIDINERWVAGCRRLGAVTYLPLALVSGAYTDWLTGHLDRAADRWSETRELMAASQSPSMLVSESRTLGLLHAYRGEVAAAFATGQALIRESTARGQHGMADTGRLVLVVANLCAGEPHAALEAALPVVQHDAVYTAEQTLPELVEAAVRSGNHEAAARAFATLDSRARTAGTAWALGVRARCRALISDGRQAEAAYLDSIGHLERSRAKVDLARAHLLYGQWLRRGKRRRDARRQLRVAEAMYDAMGADGFAAKARDELRATGERARSRGPETEFELTPQEARVGGLAAEGSTNGEIAGQLFISPSTVEYHLGKVFRKLGVRSRTQLAHRLPVHG
jgi:DNA-binding CsgD family transcriptional regulator